MEKEIRKISKTYSHKTPHSDAFKGELILHRLQEQIISMLFKVCQSTGKNGGGEKLPDFFYEARITLIPTTNDD